MTYFDKSSCFLCFFFEATNKNNQNTVNRTFPITHQTLTQLVAFLIQNISAFWPIQNKTILTTVSLHDIFAKFFISSPMHHPNTFSLSLIGGQAMVTAFQALSLVTRTHGSLLFPTCPLSFQEFTKPCMPS